MIFGFGLSNSSFNGLPIDSNWLSSYDELGLFGVCVCVLVLVFLVVNAYFQPRSMERALALFLVVYCIMASFTETGITDVSPYILEVTLAASMMVHARAPSQNRQWWPTRTPAKPTAPRPAPEADPAITRLATSSSINVDSSGTRQCCQVKRRAVFQGALWHQVTRRACRRGRSAEGFPLAASLPAIRGISFRDRKNNHDHGQSRTATLGVKVGKSNTAGDI